MTFTHDSKIGLFNPYTKMNFSSNKKKVILPEKVASLDFFVLYGDLKGPRSQSQ